MKYLLDKQSTQLRMLLLGLETSVSELKGCEYQDYRQFACWIPGNLSGLVLVKENGIYNKHQPTTQGNYRLTSDGKLEVVFNEFNGND